MVEMQPIRDIRQIRQVGSYLKNKGDKYYIMFLLGMNTGINISELLKLTLGDLREMVEHQESEEAIGYVSSHVMDIVEEYAKENDIYEDDYIIPSRKFDKYGNRYPLGRIEAYRVLHEAGEACGVGELGPQSLRKTFGYHFYMQTNDLYMLMNVLGIKNLQGTIKYIGIDEDFEKKRIMELEKFRLI